MCQARPWVQISFLLIIKTIHYTEECVERFKYCKQKALEKKIQEEEEKKAHEDASDEEYKEGDSEEESSSEDEEAAKNLNDTVKVNCTLNYKLNVLRNHISFIFKS